MPEIKEMHPEFAATAISEARRKLSGITATESFIGLGTDRTFDHQHDGSMMPIAWNNVQAMLNENKYVKRYMSPLHPIPDEVMEGYNQHHHTSQYDGGVLPGIKGVHMHSGTSDGGYAFAVFYPATTAPMIAWE